MALIRPSLTLVLDLDDRLWSHETELELKRCFSYVGAPLVRHHEPASDEDPVNNIARTIISFGARKYLHSSDEGADELWDGVMEQWIGNILHKVGSTMKAFNRRQRLIGLPEVIFDNFDVELQGGEFTVSLHPDLLGFVPAELNAAITMARSLLNDGTFAGARRVRIPADDSYAAQQGRAWEAWQLEHPTSEPAGDEAGGAQAVADGAAAEKAAKPEKIDYEDDEWLAADRERKSYENTAVPITDSDELPPIERVEEVEPPEPFSFEVDYSIWTVVFADGTVRRFDSSALAFAE